MRVSFEDKGSFDNSLKWLNGVANAKTSNAANQVASEGVNALKSNTPKDTGETASGWTSDIKMTPKGLEISWKNTAHPELQVNLAKLIELGHGTRNGGYVAPRPYIKQSMDSVFKSAGDKLAGEMFK